MQQISRKWLDLGTCSAGITSRDYTGNCGEELNMWSHMVQTWGV